MPFGQLGFGGVECQQCRLPSAGDVRLLQLGARMMMDKDFLRKSGEQLLCHNCNEKYLREKRAADAAAAATVKQAAVTAAANMEAAAADKEAAEMQAELDLLESQGGGASEDLGAGAASSIFVPQDAPTAGAE
jgi:hypothetical protein